VVGAGRNTKCFDSPDSRNQLSASDLLAIASLCVMRRRPTGIAPRRLSSAFPVPPPPCFAIMCYAIRRQKGEEARRLRDRYGIYIDTPRCDG